jgi:transcriptional regulator with XRE-family HTH domain
MPNATTADRDRLVAFGAAVKAARESRDMGQTETADLLGITARHLRNVETGRSRASNRLALRIQVLLAVDASDILRRAA